VSNPLNKAKIGANFKIKVQKAMTKNNQLQIAATQQKNHNAI
jgi:hypothetical protein